MTMGTKVEAVRSVFEQPDWYFSRRAYDIRIRAETVKQMANLREGASVLDVGCGDGSVSMPLLARNTQVTMLDLSSAMLALARSKVPAELSGNVQIINRDFMDVTFAPESFDLILCIGLLVHVVSPAALIAKMVASLKPNGNIIIECSDAHHFASRLFSEMHRLKSLFRRSKYHLNAVPYSEVVKMMGAYGFRPKSAYRYSTPPPGVNRLFSQENMYKLNRGFFGKLGADRNQWMGNEYITLFTRDGS